MTASDKKLPELVITHAFETDIEGIVALQAENQPENGGALSANFSSSKVAAMIKEMPLIVARRSNRIVGFLMTSSRAMNIDVPIIKAMLTVYSGAWDSYIYGPICISAEERGKGLSHALFDELRRTVPGREGILFIRRDNQASLRAHSKMAMTEVAEFEFEGKKLAVFSYIG